MPSAAKTIAANLAGVRERIAAAARLSGRPASDVCLVAVTKYVDVELTRTLAELGCLDLGESRPQSLWDKAESLVGLPIRWHMIGSLQRNKVKRTLPLVSLLHSVDSPRLLEAINSEASLLSQASSIKPVPILLEVNISGDAAKHGFTAEDLPAMLDHLPNYPNVSLRGLMGMAGLESDADRTRREFASLRKLRDSLLPRVSNSKLLAELSMGMSGDFEIAIEEGATIVRVGSALFAGLEA